LIIFSVKINGFNLEDEAIPLSTAPPLIYGVKPLPGSFSIFPPGGALDPGTLTMY
jgi:hypothetical protein